MQRKEEPLAAPAIKKRRTLSSWLVPDPPPAEPAIETRPEEIHPIVSESLEFCPMPKFEFRSTTFLDFDYHIPAIPSSFLALPISESSLDFVKFELQVKRLDTHTSQPENKVKLHPQSSSQYLSRIHNSLMTSTVSTRDTEITPLGQHDESEMRMEWDKELESAAWVNLPHALQKTRP
jgi:hypothetical protein